ncbi:MAG: VWA domain-containing protein [Bryobacterales bacterium]|nr:VWA domain-containing protein [Bryobacterales bacterium]MDE0624714.1 VWA domain-containing protein [Bryobacterales bacterium]
MSARAVAASLALLLLAGSLATPAQGQSARLVDQITQLISSQRGIRIYDWVNFTIKDRQVTLTGTVSNRTLRSGIARSVRKLEAVDSVVNELELSSTSGDDMGIRINAYWRIYGHPEIRRLAPDQSALKQRLRRSPEDTQRVLLQPIHIVVEDGHLTLEGELEQQREKWVAEEQAYAVLGVRSVTNNIVVTGTDTEELRPIDFENDPWWRDSQSLDEPVVRVENPGGAVRVRVVNTERVRLRRTSRSRPVQAGDTTTTRLGRKTRITASPADGAQVDLEIDLPYGQRLEVETVDGPILITGLVRRADLKTSFGRVELAVPWKSVRFAAALSRRPAHVDIPRDLRASMRSPGQPPEGSAWRIEDVRDERRSLYGRIRLEGIRPDAIVLREAAIPEDSPIRMHWQASETLSTMLQRPYRMRMSRRDGSEPPLDEMPPEAPDETVRFNSEVRLVQLSASVVDEQNRPVPGLGRDDFEVLEDGVAQEVGIVQDVDAEFNLILLLDCSTSTLVDRNAVLEAAKQFVLAARPTDQVGIYVLSDAYLQVVSPLTADREALLGMIEQIPRLSGGTPLYDAITLSYAQELARRRWERNALVVISDGMDNEMLPRNRRSVPSVVAFEDLLRVAAEINSVIYPIFLEPEEFGVRVERSWRERQRQSTDRARNRMQQLAERTGGQLFRAKSMRDLDRVYEQVAEELRSIYTLGYYPSNQEFDGEWRRIRVHVNGQAARVRTRPGYYGW